MLIFGLSEFLSRCFLEHPRLKEKPKLDWSAICDPDLGYRLKSGAVGPGGVGVNSINSLGFRGPEISLKKTKDVIRILAIGGSTTYGAGVNNDQTWPAILQKQLNNTLNIQVEVINAGVCGYLSDHHLFRIKNEFTQLKPDLFIIMMGINDINTVLFTNTTYEAVRRNKMLISNINLLESIKLFLLKNSVLFYYLDLKLRSFFRYIKLKASGKKDLEESIKEALILYYNNYLEIIEFCKKERIEIVSVNYPWIINYNLSKNQNYKNIADEFPCPYYEFNLYWQAGPLLKEINDGISKKNDMINIDLQVIFDRMEDKNSLYFDYVHLNEEGNHYIAKEVARVLINQYLNRYSENEYNT